MDCPGLEPTFGEAVGSLEAHAKFKNSLMDASLEHAVKVRQVWPFDQGKVYKDQQNLLDPQVAFRFQANLTVVLYVQNKDISMKSDDGDDDDEDEDEDDYADAGADIDDYDYD